MTTMEGAATNPERVEKRSGLSALLSLGLHGGLLLLVVMFVGPRTVAPPEPATTPIEIVEAQAPPHAGPSSGAAAAPPNNAGPVGRRSSNRDAHGYAHSPRAQPFSELNIHYERSGELEDASTG